MSHEKDVTIEFVKRVSGQQAVLTIPKLYLDMLEGDIKTALFLSQVVYWSDKGKREDGWFYKTDKEWCEELTLSEYECKKARDKLVGFGVLKVDKKKANGVPTMHYKVEWSNLSKWVSEKFNNRMFSVPDEDSDSKNLGNGNLKNSGTGSQEISESLTKTTNKDYDKEKDIKTMPKSKSLFDIASKSSLPPQKVLQALKGKNYLVRKIQFVESGELPEEELTVLDLCFYFAQRHKEIIGYEIPYQKEQYMAQFLDKYSLTIQSAYEIIPAMLNAFKQICQEDNRKKSEWYLKIGWLIYDAPSDTARVMSKVKPKVNEKYTQAETLSPDSASTDHRIVDEIF